MTLKLRDLRFTGEAASFIANPSELTPSPNDDIQRLHLETKFERFLIADLSPAEHFYSFSECPAEIKRVGWEASRLI